MRVQSVWVPVIAALSLSACVGLVGLDTQWRFSGLNSQDQTDIRAALRKITNSPIVELQPHNPDVPNEIYFYTEDQRMYRAQKIRGKWHVIDITDAIVALAADDLTRRCSQPLAAVLKG